jgi:hypothetical protein
MATWEVEAMHFFVFLLNIPYIYRVDYNISQFQIVKFENITIGSGEISKLTKLEL